MKKQKIIFALLLLFSFMTFPFQTTAHPGSTDDYGGHYDLSDGSYHYHHGYPAHSHAGGICPYDYDDQTRTGSGSGSSQKSESIYPSVEKESITRYTYKNYGSHFVVVSDGYIHLLGCPEAKDYTSYVQLNYVQTDKKPCSHCNPLANTEYIPESEYTLWEDVKTWIEEHANTMFYVLISVVSLACVAKIIRKKNHEKIEKRKHDYYFSCYAFYSPESFCEIPSGTFTKDGIPYTDGDDKYGEYTVYISEKGNCYHRRKSCLRNGSGSVQNMAFVYKTYRPCARCCKKAIDISWYEEYKRIYDIKKKYMIP